MLVKKLGDPFINFVNASGDRPELGYKHFGDKASGSMTAESSVIGNAAANFSSPSLIKDSLRELWA
jgi:hypothetical protein